MKTIATFVSLALVLALGQAFASGPAQTRVDLNATLIELQRISAATESDIAGVRIDKWGAGWKLWRGGKSQQKEEMEHIAASLQKNLNYALPTLIKDVQTSRGAISKTFKLYHDVNLVHEYLGTLADAAQANGKKEEYGPLMTDLSALEGIREKLSSYIETAAATMEATGKAPVASFSSPTTGSKTLPKKIIVDAPETRKTAKKKTTPPPQ